MFNRRWWASAAAFVLAGAYLFGHDEWWNRAAAIFVLAVTGHELVSPLWTRRRVVEAPPPAGPVFLDPLDRGEWHFSPADGGAGVELRVRGNRYRAVFSEAEEPQFRSVLDQAHADLDAGLAGLDINARFAETLGRMPFTEKSSR